jgi:hypothetical protein
MNNTTDKPLVRSGICTVITGMTLNRPALVAGKDEYWTFPLEVVGAYFDDEKEDFHNAYVSVHAHLPREDYHWIATIAPGTRLQFLVSTSLPARREEGLWDEMYDEAGRARRWFDDPRLLADQWGFGEVWPAVWARLISLGRPDLAAEIAADLAEPDEDEQIPGGD